MFSKSFSFFSRIELYISGNLSFDRNLFPLKKIQLHATNRIKEQIKLINIFTSLCFIKVLYIPTVPKPPSYSPNPPIWPPLTT